MKSRISGFIVVVGFVVLVPALGSRQAGSAPPTVLPQLAKGITTHLPGQCLPDCTEKCNCPCVTSDCSTDCDKKNTCGSCCEFFNQEHKKKQCKSECELL